MTTRPQDYKTTRLQVRVYMFIIHFFEYNGIKKNDFIG